MEHQLTSHESWETHARWWHETFTAGADPEYETQMLPLIEKHLVGHDRVLDLGTGEGQVARAAARTAQLVIGIDRSSAQIEEACTRAGGPLYVRADVMSLPFRDGAFDAVTACLVFEHIDGLTEACTEVSRILAPGGTLLLFLNHPAFQTPNSGWIDDHILEEQYWRSGPYLREQTTIEHVDAGVAIPFAHRTLSTYLNTLRRVGLSLIEMIEPAPAAVEEYPDASTIPRLLFLRLEKLVPLNT